MRREQKRILAPVGRAHVPACRVGDVRLAGSWPIVTSSTTGTARMTLRRSVRLEEGDYGRLTCAKRLCHLAGCVKSSLLGRTARMRVGAWMLVTGGVLEASALTIGSLASPPASSFVGLSVLTAYSAGWLLMGGGLAATGLSLTGRGRSALIVAGLVAFGTGIVETLQDFVGSQFGAAPSQFCYLLFIMALMVAALRLASNNAQQHLVRGSIAVPAAFFLLGLLTLFLPVAVPPSTLALPWLGLAVAGVLLLVSVRRANVVAPAASPV